MKYNVILTFVSVILLTSISNCGISRGTSLPASYYLANKVMSNQQGQTLLHALGKEVLPHFNSNEKAGEMLFSLINDDFFKEITLSDLCRNTWQMILGRDYSSIYFSFTRQNKMTVNSFSENTVYCEEFEYYLSDVLDYSFDYSKLNNKKGRFLILHGANDTSLKTDIIFFYKICSDYMEISFLKAPLNSGIIVSSKKPSSKDKQILIVNKKTETLSGELLIK